MSGNTLHYRPMWARVIRIRLKVLRTIVERDKSSMVQVFLLPCHFVPRVEDVCPVIKVEPRPNPFTWISGNVRKLLSMVGIEISYIFGIYRAKGGNFGHRKDRANE